MDRRVLRHRISVTGPTTKQIQMAASDLEIGKKVQATLPIDFSLSNSLYIQKEDTRKGVLFYRLGLISVARSN